MAGYDTLLHQLCAKRATLAQTIVAKPEQVTDEQIRDLAALQSAILAIEAEKRIADRESILEHAVDHITGP
jgi:hypothetical protein